MTLPVLAFTSGDPAGVGPEVAAAAARDPAVRGACRPLGIGPRGAFAAAGWRPGLFPIIEAGVFRAGRPRGPSADGGRASYAAVLRAVRLCARGLVQGVVTAPCSKQSWALAGLPHKDHTDLLKHETGSRRVGMWLEGAGLRTVLVTRHIPLRDVPAAVSYRAVADAAELAAEGLRLSAGLRRPRLGLCALNPHAGDAGVIGDEERRVLAPAAARLRRRGLGVEGPLPADAAWMAHADGRLDALLALHHDQALVPLKLRAGYGVVNWTLGIPLVRTSPGHGTAFDAARVRGGRKADPSGMKAAALLAAKIAAERFR